jgi:LL-diaminopimelate aminotransferase
MALSESNHWLPRLDDIPKDVRRQAKLMFLNYPNNPTGACAPRSFFEEAVAFAREYGILIAHDAAYSETYYAAPPPSILQIPGAKNVAIELHSLSKTFNMTGWRVGFAVGHKDAIASLAKLKNNLDSGVFGAIQDAAIAGLRGYDRKEVRDQVEIYRRRRDVLVNGLNAAGWSVHPPEATFYAWVRCPIQLTSMAVVSRILDEANVVVIPGVGFGEAGDGYVRFALTVSELRTREAVERIARLRF